MILIYSPSIPYKQQRAECKLFIMSTTDKIDELHQPDPGPYRQTHHIRTVQWGAGIIHTVDIRPMRLHRSAIVRDLPEH